MSKKAKKKVRRFVYGYGLSPGGVVYGRSGDFWIVEHQTLRDATHGAQHDLTSPESDRYVYELVPVKKFPGKKARP